MKSDFIFAIIILDEKSEVCNSEISVQKENENRMLHIIVPSNQLISELSIMDKIIHSWSSKFLESTFQTVKIHNFTMTAAHSKK